MFWLSALIANGVFSSLLIWCFGYKFDSRKIALVSCLAGIFIFYMLTMSIDLSQGSMAVVESYTWIPCFNIGLKLGIDGVSWVLIALTLIINIIIVLSSFLDNTHRYRCI